MPLFEEEQRLAQLTSSGQELVPRGHLAKPWELAGRRKEVEELLERDQASARVVYVCSSVGRRHSRARCERVAATQTWLHAHLFTVLGEKPIACVTRSGIKSTKKRERKKKRKMFSFFEELPEIYVA